MLFFFFFQAEDGIRDRTVTGVQTCALPIFAVIAYRQPVTRAEVEAIRGVNCDQTIYTLSSRWLIEERGRKETAGRPILYGTTLEFLACFVTESLHQLRRALTPSGADMACDGGWDSA